MTPSQPESPTPDLAALWSNARRLHPIYAELAREFVIELPACDALATAADSPERESVEQARQWLNDLDERIQVHQLRQFLQTSSMVDPEALVTMLQHLLAKGTHSDSVRDKIDFLLVQYFSQSAPSDIDDNGVDLAYVANSLEPILGTVELKAPVWLNALDRVLDSARRCRSLDELLHGGVLEQGRKAKGQAGDLFYLPVALIAFTRFGYLMRRVFFRLMLADLNGILDGLTELEEKGVDAIDCRRAQFSAQEPVIRLRMICQSWKVMFQAEYSSGQPLRMLVDLRASVDAALGRGTAPDDSGKATQTAPRAAAAAGAAGTGRTVAPGGAAAAATGTNPVDAKPVSTKANAKPAIKPTPAKPVTPEFEISAAAPEWDAGADQQPPRKK